MIRFNEASGTGTITEQGTAKNGSTLGSTATAATVDHGRTEPPLKPPPTASPSPAPGPPETLAGGGVRREGATAGDSPPPGTDPSPTKASTTAAQEGSRKEDRDPDPGSPAGAKKRRSDPQREGGENHKSGEDAGNPIKRGSGARRVVAVEEADRGAEGRERNRAGEEEAGTGAPPEKLPRFSMPVSGQAIRLTLRRG